MTDTDEIAARLSDKTKRAQPWPIGDGVSAEDIDALISDWRARGEAIDRLRSALEPFSCNCPDDYCLREAGALPKGMKLDCTRRSARAALEGKP